MDSLSDGKEEYLLRLINEAWELLEQKPKYTEFNQKFQLKSFDEDSMTELGVDGQNRISQISLMATITDVLCGKRLAAIVEDDGTISGWQWWTEN